MSGEGSDGSVKQAAIAFMRNRSEAGMREKRQDTTTGPVHSVKAVPAFAELDQHRRLRAQRAASELLGVSNPFYQPHEGTAGVTTLIGGRTLLNFASYDYLGLNRHEEVRAAAIDAATRYGISASASRLVAGERPVHALLEQNIAGLYNVEAAIAMVSGYLTNVTTIACLMGPADLILYDELMHNSVLVGAQLSGATRRSFRHNDLDDLERQLIALSSRHRNVLIVVEALYSMDGDISDLPALLRLRSKYGFWLMVDEAHGLGVLGETGRGLAEHWKCDPGSVDIWMGTLSKTTASSGGYVAGSSDLIELLKGYAGGFVYSVGLSPVLAAAANCALDILRREPERVSRLQSNGVHFLQAARAAGLDVGSSDGFAVVPVLVGDSLKAVQLSNGLVEDGVNVLPIIFPAVPESSARLRFFVTSEHSTAQLDTAIGATQRRLRSLPDVGVSGVDPARIARSVELSSGSQET